MVNLFRAFSSHRFKPIRFVQRQGRRSKPQASQSSWLIFAAACALLTAGAQLAAQDFASIRGTVIDAQFGVPVGGIIVTAMPQGNYATTDADGRFLLLRLPPGETVLKTSSPFTADGRFGPYLLREGTELEIVLEVRSLETIGSPQEVTAEREETIGTTSFDRAEIAASNARSVGEFLNHRGIHIESDGRTQYASLRGYTPQSVLVLLDGVPLNPDGGAADLSSIPVRSIGRIEIVTSGAAARYGANALGGAINIVTYRPQTLSTAGLSGMVTSGSFDLKKMGSIAEFGMLGTIVAANYEYQRQENDYEYEHPYLGNQPRRNNFRRAYAAFVSAQSVRWPELSLTAQLSNSHSGLPGAVFQETTGATLAKRENQLLALRYADHDLEVTGSYREIGQYFRDREAHVAYEKDYRQIARQFSALWTAKPIDGVATTVGGTAVAETFFNDDLVQPNHSLPRTSRRSGGLFAGARLERRLGKIQGKLDGRWRIDRIGDDDHASPFGGVTARFGESAYFGGDASYGESFRLPPLDALFWREDVFTESNPSLRPETAIMRDVGIVFGTMRPLRVEGRVTWFSSNLADLIVWRRQFDGKYKPVNVDRAHHSGTELSLQTSLLRERVSLSYSRKTLAATNESPTGGYQGNTIPFKPNRSERFGAEFTFWQVRTQYHYSFTGERYIREANSKALPGFALHDIIVELKFHMWQTASAVRLAVYNLTNKRYELLERMPMPLRSVSFTYSLEV